jgi:G3E family GTPase
VCCTVRGDLIKALTTLMKRGKKFDHVLIETTGLADPAPVAFVSALRSAGRAHRRLGVAALRVVARRWRNRRAPTR